MVELRMSQNVDESDLKEDYLSQLRKLLLTVIHHTGLLRIHLLEVLDLSSTSIQSLPSCISSLSSLKELLLRDCSFLIELPIEIGKLTKLKLLDMEGSEIMYIPKEIVEVTELEVLRLCLSQYAQYYIKTKNVNGGVVVPRMMISKLKKLKELCISVCQEAEWWEKEIKEIQDEICHLENLEFLKWYLPTDTTLKQFLDIQINRKPAYEKLFNFTFTIGQHAQLTSCLPRGLEKKFAEFEKCLKWINAEGNIYHISKIMTRAKALFLSRHWTIVNLSDFDISKLKYFLLAECNEMETLVNIDDLSEVVEDNKKGGLESLEYLSIHYMEKLKSIWEGPIGKDSLSRLRILALHTCLELTTIFTPRIAQNLSCLVELTVEECPKVRSLISTLHSKHGLLFPSLERIFLIDLPELVHIFGGLIVLEKLESLMIYNCVKLRRLSEMELPRIQKIKGENKWWNSLNAYAPTWENVFEPLKEKSELIKQLLEATNSLQHFHDVVSREAKDEKPLDGPGLGAQETKTDPWYFLLRKEKDLFLALLDSEDEVTSSESDCISDNSCTLSVASDSSSLYDEDFIGFEAVTSEISSTVVSQDGEKSIFAVENKLDCVPLWGFTSIIGRRTRMEDAVAMVPRFLKVPIQMLTGDRGIHRLTKSLSHLTTHFFGVYDGHGGCEVANYCSTRVHTALQEELEPLMASWGSDENGTNNNDNSCQEMWRKAFFDCFLKVDYEISGQEANDEPVVPETVGSTAAVAVICSSHIIVSNCGDSRAVLCRGKEAMALSVDHKANREDEYARITAAGGKIIEWHGHRVFGVLGMSRSIGDRYLKPWIIPDPEVTFIPRANEDECLILASDGLWDVMSNEEVCEIARKRILVWHKMNGATNLPQERGEGIDPAAQAAAESLSNRALQKGSNDNITVIVIDLKEQRKFNAKT